MAKQNGESIGGKKHTRQTLRPVGRGKQIYTFHLRLRILTIHSGSGSLTTVRTGPGRGNRGALDREVSRLLSPQPRIGVVSGDATLISTGTASS
jgi:hypothetical protein